MNTLKTGSIMLTGLGAYLILSKAIGAAERSAERFADALAWRSYYKCTRKDPVPPHYSRTTHPTDDTEGLDDELPKDIAKQDSVANAGEVLGKALVKTIDNLFKKPDEPEEALEDDLDACETSSEVAEEEECTDPPTMENTGEDDQE